MKKLIANINDDVVLKRLFTDGLARSDDQTKRAHFLLNKLEGLKEEAKADSRKHWASVEAHLKSRGLLPQDYNKDKQMISFDEESGELSLEPNPISGVKDALRQMATALGVSLPPEIGGEKSFNADPPIMFEENATIH